MSGKSAKKKSSAKRTLNAHALTSNNNPPEEGSTKGAHEQDWKRRIGQHEGAGEPPLMKK